jgi:hypothetical protein
VLSKQDGSRTTVSCIQVASRAELGRLIEGGLNNIAVCDQPMSVDAEQRWRGRA